MGKRHKIGTSCKTGVFYQAINSVFVEKKDGMSLEAARAKDADMAKQMNKEETAYATLQQENQQLRAQLAAQSSGAREAESETQQENSRLRSELQLARSRVAALERAMVDSARESNHPLEFAGGTAQGVPRSYGGPGGFPA